ncbi:MAG: zinc-finger protein [Watsoniomyces obsoletus]|nr:MAG: zinc-finger protein [Watsoniomyces obsoletus]
MGFFKHIRSKSKQQQQQRQQQQDQDRYGPGYDDGFGRTGFRGFPSNLAARLPTAVLDNIFRYVCPHVEDRSYLTAEESMVDGCMLCDMRDLAHCSLVCRRWNEVAMNLLYSSVRIDAVHYCEREAELAEKRKHRFFERNADPRDAPRARLALFCQTVRARDHLARRVLVLKLAYMTREVCKADLARTVSVLPNLQYVDLPEGFFADDNSCTTLRTELQARCPDIRRMKYTAGGEHMFTYLSTRRTWQSLEVLELAALNAEPAMLVRVLGSLLTLHELKMSDMSWVDDTLFDTIPGYPSFPPLHKLSLENMSSLSASGLVTYLSRPETREVLSSLTLRDTDIHPASLHSILAQAPYLTHLSIIETVSRSFPSDSVPLMASTSLVALHYEIMSARSMAQSMQPPSKSYYAYLAQSLHANALPSLRALYVRDADFPETLILEPPRPGFAQMDDHYNPMSSAAGRAGAAAARGFTQELEVYSKGLDELEWNFTCVSPPTGPGPGNRGSYTPQRPISAYKFLEAGHPDAANVFLNPSGDANMRSGGGGGLVGPSMTTLENRLSLPPGWAVGAGAGDARKSVLVGNGFGGFLAVPVDESQAGKRPGSAGSWRNSGGDALGGSGGGGADKKHGRGKSESRRDLWR